jgi:hypothetical protein
MSYKNGTSGTVQDWATRAARKIDSEIFGQDHRGRPVADRVAIPRLAAIIVTLAQPLLDLLKPREHYHCEDGWYCCGKCPCRCTSRGSEDHEHDEECYPSTHTGEAARTGGVCNCGADEWNKKLEEALR